MRCLFDTNQPPFPDYFSHECIWITSFFTKKNMKPHSEEFCSFDLNQGRKRMYSFSLSVTVRWTPKCVIFTFFWEGVHMYNLKSCIPHKTTSRTLLEAFPNHKRTWSGQEFQWPQNGLCCTTTTWSRWWYIAQVIADLTTVLHASRKRPPTLISTGTFVESLSSHSFLTHAGINHTGQLILPRERNDLRGIFNSNSTCLLLRQKSKYWWWQAMFMTHYIWSHFKRLNLWS